MPGEWARCKWTLPSEPCPSWCEGRGTLLGDSGLGLSVTFVVWNTEAPDGWPEGGNVMFPVWEVGDVEALEPAWLVDGGKRPPGEGLPAAMGGYVLDWRGW